MVPVPVAVAVAQVAAEFGVVAGVVAADAALRRRLCTRAALEEAVTGLGKARGVAAARAMTRRCDGRSQSPGETLMRLRLEDLGYQMEPQFQVVSEDGEVITTVDGRIKGTRALLEFDGVSKYAGADGQRELVAEKRREDAIRRRGWLLDRLLWPDLEPSVLQTRVHDLLRRGDPT